MALWVHVFFRHWNSPQSCQHFQGEVEYGRSSTGGASGLQGERGPRAPDRLRLHSAIRRHLVFFSVLPGEVSHCLNGLSIGTGHKQVAKHSLLVLITTPLRVAVGHLSLLHSPRVATLNESLGSLSTRMLFYFMNVTLQCFPKRIEKTGKVYKSCVGVLIYCTEKKK